MQPLRITRRFTLRPSTHCADVQTKVRLGAESGLKSGMSWLWLFNCARQCEVRSRGFRRNAEGSLDASVQQPFDVRNGVVFLPAASIGFWVRLQTGNALAFKPSAKCRLFGQRMQVARQQAGNQRVQTFETRLPAHGGFNICHNGFNIHSLLGALFSSGLVPNAVQCSRTTLLKGPSAVWEEVFAHRCVAGNSQGSAVIRKWFTGPKSKTPDHVAGRVGMLLDCN